LLFLLGIVHVSEHFVEHVIAQVFVRRQQLDKLLPLNATELVNFMRRSSLDDLEVSLKQARLLLAVRRKSPLLALAQPDFDQLLPQTLALGMYAFEK
jgi:hypothetical protein